MQSQPRCHLIPVLDAINPLSPCDSLATHGCSPNIRVSISNLVPMLEMWTLLPEACISSRDKWLHPTEYCGMQLHIPGRVTCFWQQSPHIPYPISTGYTHLSSYSGYLQVPHWISLPGNIQGKLTGTIYWHGFYWLKHDAWTKWHFANEIYKYFFQMKIIIPWFKFNRNF